MSRRAQFGVLAAIAVAGAALWVWSNASSIEEREIRRQFADFTADFNAGSSDGLDAVIRAARIGQFFTEDVVVELGQGSPAIHGRDTLVGMAARLQPRTAAFVLELTDLTADVHDGGRAEVTFTAVIRRRSVGSGEESLDAREFSADMRHVGGQWRVSRLVAIDTLR